MNFFVYSQSVHLNLQVIYNTFKLCSFDNQIIISNLVSKMNLNSKFDPVKYHKLLIHVSTVYATNFLLKTTHRRIERYELLGVNWKSEFEKQN